MADKILVKRGLKANLPTLSIGEPAYCTDTKEFFVGTASGNVLINDHGEITAQLAEKAKQADVTTGLAAKVDKVTGKGLSTNDYDNVEKAEVAKVKNKADTSYVDTGLATKANKSDLDTTNATVVGHTTQLADIASIDAALTVTVGTGGNYTTINDALAYLSKKKLKYGSSIKAEIKLLTGFIMSEQIFVDGLDLGWIKIISEDAVVTVNRSAITTQRTFVPASGVSSAVSGTMVFAVVNNGALPVIGCLFNMDTSGTNLSQGAFFAGNGGRITIAKACGCTNASGVGIYAVEGGKVTAGGCNMSGAKANVVSCFRHADVEVRSSNLSNAGANGIYADNLGKVDASGANISGALQVAVWGEGASTICCLGADLSNSGGHGIIAATSSIIDAHTVIINNSLGRGISADKSAIVDAYGATILNAALDGVYAQYGASVNVSGSTVTGAGGKGLYAIYGGKITAKGTNAQKGGTTSTDDIRVAGGGIIVANGAIGGLSTNANILTGAGIIFNDDVPLDGTTFGTSQTFTPTGDWTGSLTYSKTSGGFVWLRGTLTAGTTLTPGTNIGSIIAGYRPPNAMPISSVHGTNNTQYGMHLSSSGGMYLSSTLVAGTYSINVLYKVN